MQWISKQNKYKTSAMMHYFPNFYTVMKSSCMNCLLGLQTSTLFEPQVIRFQKLFGSDKSTPASRETATPRAPNEEFSKLLVSVG